MTLEPEKPSVRTDQQEVDLTNLATLEDLFYLGYATSDKIVIYNDEKKNHRIEAVFRTLTPTEIQDVYESTGIYSTVGAQEIAQKFETLARSIRTINGMPLTLSTKDKEEFKEKYEKDPSPLEQARSVLAKIQSKEMIDALYTAYKHFNASIKDHFEDIKKKSNPQIFSG